MVSKPFRQEQEDVQDVALEIISTGPPSAVDETELEAERRTLLVEAAHHGDRLDRVLVLLGDQPLLNAADMQAALDAFEVRERGQHALVPVVRGQPGHPVVLSAHACALLRGRPAGGLRAWRAENPHAVALWASPNPHYVRDLDVPDDLIRLAEDTGLRVQAPPQDPPRSPTRTRVA